MSKRTNRDGDIALAIILLIILIGGAFVFWRATVNRHEVPPPRTIVQAPEPPPAPAPTPVELPPAPPPVPAAPPSPPIVEEPLPPAVVETVPAATPPVVIPPAVPPIVPPVIQDVPNPGSFTIDIVLEKEEPCAKSVKHAKSTKHHLAKRVVGFKTWKPKKRAAKLVTCQGRSAP